MMESPSSLETASADDLATQFVATEKNALRRLGVLYWHLQIRIQEEPEYAGKSVCALLRERGASKSAISAACGVAKVYARVQAGEIPESEFETFTHRQFRDIARGDVPRPAARKGSPWRADAPAGTIDAPAGNAADAEPLPDAPAVELVAAPGDRGRLLAFANRAEGALLGSRGCFSEAMPKRWDGFITQALRQIGLLRLEASEWQPPAAPLDISRF